MNKDLKKFFEDVKEYIEMSEELLDEYHGSRSWEQIQEDHEEPEVYMELMRLMEVMK
jgi:hypothetical protein